MHTTVISARHITDNPTVTSMFQKQKRVDRAKEPMPLNPFRTGSPTGTEVVALVTHVKEKFGWVYIDVIIAYV